MGLSLLVLNVFEGADKEMMPEEHGDWKRTREKRGKLKERQCRRWRRR
jgi:hypothetical protein